MDLHDIFRILRRGAWVLVITTALGGAAGLFRTVTTAPTYTATTSMFVAVQTGSAQSAAELNQGNTLAQQRITSYLDVAKSPSVLRPVAREFGVVGGAGALAARTTVSNPAGTVVIKTTVTSDDPAQAAALANAVRERLSSTIVDDIEKPTEGSAVPVRLSTFQEAEAPGAPSGPDHVSDVLFGVAAGLALGLAIVFLRAMLDTRLIRPSDVEDAVDLPLLGTSGFDPEAGREPLVVRSEPRGLLAEAYRDLRTNISYLDGEAQLRTLVVSSALQSEGKSTTVANLAVVLSENGSRTLVVDADLRRPRMADLFGLEGSAGLSDVLVGRAEPEDVIQPWGLDGVHVLPAGRIPPNPSELLGSPTMRALLADLREQYDTILIDAPPLLPVTDAAVLSKVSDGVMVVTASRRSKRTQLAAAVDRLRRIDARVLGVVLTMSRARNENDVRYGAYSAYEQSGADIAEQLDDTISAARRRALPEDGRGTAGATS